jgi:hypothetical protein
LKRWAQGFFILSFGAMFSGCLQGGAGSQGQIPKILEVGKSYTFTVPMAGQARLKVLEIDREAGWIKVDGGKQLPQNTWVNLKHIVFIRPVAQQ